MLTNETRSQATDRFLRDGGVEADFIRAVEIETDEGKQIFQHCNICGAPKYTGAPVAHLFYCPFVPADDEPPVGLA